MRPVLFHLPDWLPGPLADMPIPAYGVISAVGAIAASLVFAWLIKRTGSDGGKAFELLLETILVAWAGAKIFGLLFQPAGGASVWEKLLKTGGVWYIGLLVGLAWLTVRGPRVLGMPMLRVLDHAAAAVPVGHAFGRLACFFAGCCYGGRCELPWAVTFHDELAHRQAGVPLGVPLHPTQLYEMSTELLLAGFLAWWLLKRSRFDGQTGLFYLIGYAVLRFCYEFLRDDHRGGLGVLTTSQFIAVAVLAVAVPALVLGLRRGFLLPPARR